jgi:mono/diheme cytochrome c family protein
LLAASPSTTGRSTQAWPPQRLQDTGLYADWASKTVRPDNLAYSPQYPLWTDGAAKSRWLHLPAGTWIDASNVNQWKFPVGTRLWKEFRFNGRRAETRLIEHSAAGWRYATYEWNADQTEAPLAPERGVAQSVEIRDGVHHGIPSRADCRACHEASPVRVLGFNALQLSPDRDPNAPHAEPVPAGGVDLRTLVERRLVRGLPRSYLTTPPRINASTPTARAALGYLNTNCGICHNTSGELASLAFSLGYPLGGPADAAAPAVVTALGHASKFKVAGEVERISAGDPDASVLIARMATRNPIAQMPPLGTRLVDEDAVRLIRRWIAEDLAGRASPSISREVEKK